MFLAETAVRLALDGWGLHLYPQAISLYKMAFARADPAEQDRLFKRCERAEECFMRAVPDQAARELFSKACAHLRHGRLAESLACTQEAFRPPSDLPHYDDRHNTEAEWAEYQFARALRANERVAPGVDAGMVKMQNLETVLAVAPRHERALTERLRLVSERDKHGEMAPQLSAALLQTDGFNKLASQVSARFKGPEAMFARAEYWVGLDDDTALELYLELLTEFEVCSDNQQRAGSEAVKLMLKMDRENDARNLQLTLEGLMRQEEEILLGRKPVMMTSVGLVEPEPEPEPETQAPLPRAPLLQAPLQAPQQEPQLQPLRQPEPEPEPEPQEMQTAPQPEPAAQSEPDQQPELKPEPAPRLQPEPEPQDTSDQPSTRSNRELTDAEKRVRAQEQVEEGNRHYFKRPPNYEMAAYCYQAAVDLDPADRELRNNLCAPLRKLGHQIGVLHSAKHALSLESEDMRSGPFDRKRSLEDLESRETAGLHHAFASMEIYKQYRCIVDLCECKWYLEGCRELRLSVGEVAPDGVLSLLAEANKLESEQFPSPTAAKEHFENAAKLCKLFATNDMCAQPSLAEAEQSLQLIFQASQLGHPDTVGIALIKSVALLRLSQKEKCHRDWITPGSKYMKVDTKTAHLDMALAEAVKSMNTAALDSPTAPAPYYRSALMTCEIYFAMGEFRKAIEIALQLEDSSHGHLARAVEISRLAHGELGQKAPVGRRLTKSEKNRRKKLKQKEKQREKERYEGADSGTLDPAGRPEEEKKADRLSKQVGLEGSNEMHRTSTSSSSCSSGSGSGVIDTDFSSTNAYGDLGLDIGLGLGAAGGGAGEPTGGVIGGLFSHATAARAARFMQAGTSGDLGAARHDDGAEAADELATEMEQRFESSMDALLGDEGDGADGGAWASRGEDGAKRDDKGGGGGGAAAGGAEMPDVEVETRPARTTPASLKELVGIVRAELGLSEELAPKQVVSEVVKFVEAKPPATVVGLRGEIEWAVVELLGMARAQELGCCKAPNPSTKKSSLPAGSQSDVEPPEEFLCPISCELMEDPATTLAGNTYEKTHIMAWFRTHQTDPLTNAKLSSKRLVPNNLLRSQIHAWIQAHPSDA